MHSRQLDTLQHIERLAQITTNEATAASPNQHSLCTLLTFVFLLQVMAIIHIRMQLSLTSPSVRD